MDGMGRLEHGETDGVPAAETVTTDHPRTPGILPADTVDVKKKVWSGEGRERRSTCQKSDKNNKVKKIVVKMFQQFPSK